MAFLFTKNPSSVRPPIQEEHYGFHPGCQTVDQLFTIVRLLEGSGEFAHHIYMCFVDLEKGSPLGGTVGVWCTGAVATRYLVRVYPKQECLLYSWHKVKHFFIESWPLPELFLVILSKGTVRGMRLSSFSTSELCHCSLQMMVYCWLQIVTCSTNWGGLQQSVKWLVRLGGGSLC